MPYQYKDLRGRIRAKFGTEYEFARALGLTPNSISLKLTGKRSISQSDIAKWSTLLDIKENEYGLYFFT